MKLIFVMFFVFMSIKNYAQEAGGIYSDMSFNYDEVTGIGFEDNCVRRDNSDIIKVGDTYYVYYTKKLGTGNWAGPEGGHATIWYATSKDRGYHWTEEGEALSQSQDSNAFDSHTVFTPNILNTNGIYYLYYTGIKPTYGTSYFENNSLTDITAIGLAVSNSPDGPFVRYQEEPVLEISADPEKFDSYRIDDAALLYRNGLYWLYYKGRSRIDGDQGPSFTHMGVAFSKKPEGPFEKFDKPLLPGSHEVMVWQQGYGVGALACLNHTLEYAPDGIDFKMKKIAYKLENEPRAPGIYRPELTNPIFFGEGLTWGISMLQTKDRKIAWLTRFEIIEKN